MNKWLERLKARNLETESQQIFSFKTVKTAKSNLSLENDRLEPESFQDQAARQGQEVDGKIISLLPPEAFVVGPQIESHTLQHIQKCSSNMDTPRPYLDRDGDPVIPFNSHPKYLYWTGGQSLATTLKELWEERAAIREYDGGQVREVAERGAWEDIQ